jgi:uncharacterized protein YecT (DUF1311 family)
VRKSGMNWFVVLCALLMLISPALGEDEKHPIDRFYEACLEKSDSTSGMVQCAAKAHEKWDSELNRVYRLSSKDYLHKAQS